MQTKKLLTIIVMVQAFTLGAVAQPVNMKVWPAGVPGSKQALDYTENTIDKKDGIMRVERVTDPEIAIYLPKKEKATGMAVLIIPGGGYGIVAIDHEGYAIAQWLNEQGIAGIVLKYRLPSDKIMEDKSVGPLQDAQEAIRIIRRNAAAWKINPKKIGAMGFSAGGHLASTLSTHYMEKVYNIIDTTSARPDFSILVYPVITFDQTFTHMGSRKNLIGENPNEEQVKRFSNELQVNAQTPPAFLVHSGDDKTVPIKNSISYYTALQQNNVPAELHVFQIGGHGYGMGRSKGTETSWPQLCLNWLKTL